jgi:hypothetical protein
MHDRRVLRAQQSGAARRSTVTAWAGYAACAWAFVFAAMSFYWASGGGVGGDTIGPAITTPVAAGDPVWIALLWVSGLLKVGVGLLALVLVRPWGARFPRRLLLVCAYGGCLVTAGYEGAASLVDTRSWPLGSPAPLRDWAPRRDGGTSSCGIRGGWWAVSRSASPPGAISSDHGASVPNALVPPVPYPIPG